MKANIALGVATAREACRGMKTLEGRVRAAMRAVMRHPRLRDDSERYAAAVGAAIRESEGDDKRRLLDSCEAGAAVAARESGRNVEMPMIDPKTVLPLVLWWQQEKRSATDG